MNNNIISFILVLVCVHHGFSQQNSTWNFGDQVDVAKEKNVMYSDAFKAGSYEEAIAPLEWLLKNTPDLNPSIYINGGKIYEKLALSTTEQPAKKEEYIDKGLKIFDDRVKIFGGAENVMPRKFTFAYKVMSKHKEQYAKLFEIAHKIFQDYGDHLGAGNYVAFMNTVYKYRIFNKADMPDNRVIDLYSQISENLNNLMEKTEAPSKRTIIKKCLSQVDKILTATKVEIKCEFIDQKLGPKLEESKDLNMAKKIFSLSLKGKCLDSPYAFKAAKIIQEHHPNFGIAKFLAGKSFQEGKIDDAIKLFQEAATLADENEEKADVYLNIARILSKNGQKSRSRNAARKALAFDPSNKSSYKLIGDLYMGSFNDCQQGKSRVDDRAVFIAAYYQYQKAGNASAMAKAKNQFPSIEEIFNEGKAEGEAVTVGCWINTTVQLEKRPAAK